MKMQTDNMGKRIYCTPQMEQIELDNEISLAMESTPPDTAPGESFLKQSDYFNNDPFKLA